jgi:hypothetical protein
MKLDIFYRKRPPGAQMAIEKSYNFAAGSDS